MAYIKYGFLAAVLLVVTVLVASTPAKESIQQWGTTVAGEATAPFNNKKFTASPTSGDAPLKVRFTTGIAASDTRSYFLEYGVGGLSYLCVGNDTCGMPRDYGEYTYNVPGTYTAKLEEAMSGRAQTVTIVVTGQLHPGFNVYPRPDGVSRELNFTISGGSISFTRCTEVNLDFTLDFGDGSTQPIHINNTCSIQTTSHVYSTTRPYTAKLLSGVEVFASAIVP